MTDKLAIYVSSYDGAADTWQPFFAYFFRYWANCPFQIYLGVNERRFDHARVKCVAAPAKLTWSKHTRLHLEQIPHDYVLFTLDDFFISRAISTETINSLVDDMEKLDLTTIRLVRDPPPVKSISGAPRIGMFPPWAQLRTSCSPTLWRRQDLISLLHDEENIWKFEVNGAIRSHRFNGVCGTWKPAWYHRHAIAQGKWFPWIIRQMKRDGIAADILARPHHSYLSAWKDLLNVHVSSRLRKIIPHRLRQIISPIILGKQYGL